MINPLSEGFKELVHVNLMKKILFSSFLKVMHVPYPELPLSAHGTLLV